MCVSWPVRRGCLASCGERITYDQRCASPSLNLGRLIQASSQKETCLLMVPHQNALPGLTSLASRHWSEEKTSRTFALVALSAITAHGTPSRTFALKHEAHRGMQLLESSPPPALGCIRRPNPLGRKSNAVIRTNVKAVNFLYSDRCKVIIYLAAGAGAERGRNMQKTITA